MAPSHQAPGKAPGRRRSPLLLVPLSLAAACCCLLVGRAFVSPATLTEGRGIAPVRLAAAPKDKLLPDEVAKDLVRDDQFDSILAELEEKADDEYDGEDEPDESPWTWFTDNFTWILVADVFIVIFLSLWFLLGVALKYALGDMTVLKVFLAYWDPYFQSLLGVLFAGRLLGVMLSQALGK
mmetsp:Transcript_78885/g.170479  ORF Transcript_78885/g.170479 Transcript_78885/m.170479 type:complete len:181 (-) Transcript_78885:84-626(-)